MSAKTNKTHSFTKMTVGELIRALKRGDTETAKVVLPEILHHATDCYDLYEDDDVAATHALGIARLVTVASRYGSINIEQLIELIGLLANESLRQFLMEESHPAAYIQLEQIVDASGILAAMPAAAAIDQVEATASDEGRPT